MTRINHNIASMINQKWMGRHNDANTQVLNRLSTGLRINSAADDQPGFSASEMLRAQIRGNMMAVRNANDGMSLLRIAEGAAGEITSLLQRMRELGVQASNDALTSTDRGYINQEFQQLKEEVDRIAKASQYNTMTLLDGSTGAFGTQGGLSCILHIGANTLKTVDRMRVSITPITTGSLKLETLALTGHLSAFGAITPIDKAIGSVNLLRSELGSMLNRLEYTVPALEAQATNLQASESTIRDADFAAESTEFTKTQILAQTATSMLSQANNSPQKILQLFGAR